MVVHAFNPNTQQAEPGRYLSLKLAWHIERVPEESEIHRRYLKNKENKTKK